MLESLRRDKTPPTDLIGIISHVRSRWRTKLLVRGAVAVALICAAVFFLAAYVLEWSRFSGPSIIAARVLLVAVALASVGWFLVRPMRRRVTDEQVALYLEEHEPSLQATLVSAVEASREGRTWESNALVQRLAKVKELAQHTERHGRPASQDPYIRRRIARCDTIIEAMRLNGLRYLTKQLRGEPLSSETSVNKLHRATLEIEFGELALEIEGPASQYVKGAPEAGQYGYWQLVSLVWP